MNYRHGEQILETDLMNWLLHSPNIQHIYPHLDQLSYHNYYLHLMKNYQSFQESMNLSLALKVSPI